MDIEKYIASGVLESYVLGVATPEEVREVEANAAQYPEIRNEIEAIRDSVERYATAHSKNPPAHLRSKILNEIDKLDAGKEHQARVIEMDTGREKQGTLRWLSIAAILLLLLSAIFNVIQYNRLHQANERIAELESEQSVLANEFNTVKAAYTQQQSELAVYSNPNNVTVLMKGVEKQPDALASVIWNAQTKEVFLAIANLPQPPADKQYQLWAIVDGKPVDMGVFDVTDSLQKMKTVQSAQAFAVTLEQKGGSPAPTLEQMYVIGNV